MRVQLALASLVNSVFINVQEKNGKKSPLNKHGHAFLPISNYPQFIFNHFLDGQKPSLSGTPKKDGVVLLVYRPRLLE